MNARTSLVALFCLSAVPTSALAQEAVVQGAGYKVGEGTVLHPTVGAETGYDSNVFYEQSDPIAAPVLRLLVELGISSLSPQRLDDSALESGEAPAGADPKLEFSAGGSVAYQEYLSGNSNVRAQRDLAVELDARATAFPRGPVAFFIEDNFVRHPRPTNFESSKRLTRDINLLRLGLVFQPGGRALKAGLRYENRLDFFESNDSQFANRLQHTLGFRSDWQFLPVTRFYFDGSIGFFGALGDDTVGGTTYKESSMPLRLLLGTDTAITETVTVSARAGFGKGFYEAGEDFTGPLVGVEFGYRYSPLGRLLAKYQYDFQDSLNSNFYTDHLASLSIDQQIALILLSASAEARLRTYRGISSALGGPTTRDDTIFAGRFQGRYMYRDWLAVTADYEVVVDETDYMYTFDGTSDNPSYTRHLVTAGARAAF